MWNVKDAGSVYPFQYGMDAFLILKSYAVSYKFCDAIFLCLRYNCNRITHKICHKI